MAPVILRLYIPCNCKSSSKAFLNRDSLFPWGMQSRNRTSVILIGSTCWCHRSFMVGGWPGSKVVNGCWPTGKDWMEMIKCLQGNLYKETDTWLRGQSTFRLVTFHGDYSCWLLNQHEFAPFLPDQFNFQQCSHLHVQSLLMYSGYACTIWILFKVPHKAHYNYSH